MSYVIEKCTLCPRQCSARRDEQSGSGFCGAESLPRVCRIAPHMWEEPCISGTRGSGTIFFSGCTLRCVFCQNYEISRNITGKQMNPSSLADAFRRLEESGVHNINLVSPTPYIDSIIEAFSLYRPSIPVVYNTGGYERAETIRRLDGIVDIYLPDMKYIRSELSGKYSKAGDYFEYADAALHEMVRQTGKPVFNDDGMMLRGTIVRHLILPQNTRNSIDVLNYLSENFGDRILVSLMGQYTPVANAADYPEINRRITAREYDKLLSHLEQLELDGFAQQLGSAKEEYIPDFDLERD